MDATTDPKSEPTILVVEDDRVFQRTIIRSFKKNGIGNPVRTARDGQEAIDVLRGDNGQEKLKQPYLITLDMNMPVMDGIEFLQTIRQDDELKGSIVFVLTTSDDERDKVAAYQESVAGYLLKHQAGDDLVKFTGLLDRFLMFVEFPPRAEK